MARGLWLAALGGLAALYFHGTVMSTIELMDEGQVVYSSWRVAEGEMPYVGFHQLYGPSVFFVNGALLKLFGVDLRVIRLSLVVLKALVAVFVYVLTRRVASRPVALVLYGLLVAIWGMPIWLFNTPYATYYATALSLAGLLLASAERARWIASGVCMGLAMTFKQTQGIFAFLAIVLFVIVMTPPRAGPATHAARARQWAGGVRLLALGGTLAFAVAYVAPHLATVSAILMLAPLAVLVAGLVVREMAGWPPHDPAIAGLGPIALVSVGAAIPVLAYVALYWRIGALAAFVHDTMVGLPQQIAWFVPLRQPELATVCLTATICASFALVRRLRRGISLTGPLLVCVGAIAGLLVDRARNPGLQPYLLSGRWMTDFFGVLPGVPFFAVGVGALALLGAARRRQAAAATGRPDAGGDEQLGLLVPFAAITVLQLYPSADLPHVAMVLPAFLPLLGYAITRRIERDGPMAAGLALAWLAALSSPFLGARVALSRETFQARFDRASGISGPRLDDAARVVRYLGDAAAPDGDLLVLVDQPMLYFLAGRRSALSGDEYVFYVVGAGYMADEVARKLVDEQDAIRDLARIRPVVVDRRGSVESTRFRRTFPSIARFIDETYRPATSIGGYQVLVPARDTPPG